MAIVQIKKNIYLGWRVGDHVSVTGAQLDRMLAEYGCEIIESDIPQAEEVVLPVLEEVREEIKKVKKSKKIK